MLTQGDMVHKGFLLEIKHCKHRVAVHAVRTVFVETVAYYKHISKTR